MPVKLKRAKAKKADEDIECYKVLAVFNSGTVLVSPMREMDKSFQYSLWNYNEVKVSELSYPKDYRSEEGLYSFGTLDNALEYCNRLGPPCSVFIAVIPKESEYHYSKSQDTYVSNKLKIIKQYS